MNRDWKGNAMQKGKVCRYERIILPPREWLLREDGSYGKNAETENLLTEGLWRAKKKVMFDVCCKRILSEKIILAWIMKCCIPEYRKFEVAEIAERFIEGTPSVGRSLVHRNETEGWKIRGDNTEDSSLHEGRVTYDVKFHAILPGTGEITEMLINIEAQNDFYPGYPLIKRALYYCCRMISSQYGTEFGKGHYEEIKKVYSIWICMNPPQARENSITRYEIKEKDIVGKAGEKKANYDLFAAIMVCLGKQTMKWEGTKSTEEQQILRMLHVLFSKELSAEEKKTILEKEFYLPMTEKMEGEIGEMCNLSEGIWAEGMEKGMKKTILEFVRKKVIKGKTLPQVAVDLDETEEYVSPFYQLILNNPDLSIDELADRMI